jgi:hypothetical protein
MSPRHTGEKLSGSADRAVEVVDSSDVARRLRLTWSLPSHAGAVGDEDEVALGSMSIT